MFFYPSKIHQAWLTAKKIILQLLGKKIQLKKNTRNTAKFLEFSLTPKGNYAGGLCYLKITLLGEF